MAGRKKGHPRKKKAPLEQAAKRPSRRRQSQGPDALGGIGHNSAEFKEALEAGLTELFGIQERMDSDNAGYRSEFKHTYDAVAKGTGLRTGVIRDEFRRALRNKKEQEKQRAFDKVEREQREMLRSATSEFELDGTPMGEWFAGHLAEGAQTDEESEQEAKLEGAAEDYEWED